MWFVYVVCVCREVREMKLSVLEDESCRVSGWSHSSMIVLPAETLLVTSIMREPSITRVPIWMQGIFHLSGITRFPYTNLLYLAAIPINFVSIVVRRMRMFLWRPITWAPPKNASVEIHSFVSFLLYYKYYHRTIEIINTSNTILSCHFYFLLFTLHIFDYILLLRSQSYTIVSTVISTILQIFRLYR